MILQLDPPIPVVVVSKGNASGMAIGWIDYSQEHHLLWVVALDDGGEVWVVPNTDVRLQANWSLGRSARSER
jgi:hypothetical protein